MHFQLHRNWNFETRRSKSAPSSQTARPQLHEPAQLENRSSIPDIQFSAHTANKHDLGYDVLVSSFQIDSDEADAEPVQAMLRFLSNDECKYSESTHANASALQRQTHWCDRWFQSLHSSFNRNSSKYSTRQLWSGKIFKQNLAIFGSSIYVAIGTFLAVRCIWHKTHFTIGGAGRMVYTELESMALQWWRRQ